MQVWHRSHQAKIKVWQGCTSYWRLWGRACFQAHWDCWWISFPCGCRTEVLVSFLALSEKKQDRPWSFLALRGHLHSLAPGSFPLSPKPAMAVWVLLMLQIFWLPFQLLGPLSPSSSTSLWLTPPPSSSAFQSPCDYIRLTQIIQDNLPILKSAD